MDVKEWLFGGRQALNKKCKEVKKRAGKLQAGRNEKDLEKHILQIVFIFKLTGTDSGQLWPLLTGIDHRRCVSRPSHARSNSAQL